MFCFNIDFTVLFLKRLHTEETQQAAINTVTLTMSSS